MVKAMAERRDTEERREEGTEAERGRQYTGILISSDWPIYQPCPIYTGHAYSTAEDHYR